jgi:hypothetical protein
MDLTVQFRCFTLLSSITVAVIFGLLAPADLLHMACNYFVNHVGYFYLYIYSHRAVVILFKCLKKYRHWRMFRISSWRRSAQGPDLYN